MEYKIKDRKGKVFIEKESKSVRFFYGTFVGRCLVKFFSLPIFSSLVGWFLSTGVSSLFIKSFIKKNGIDMSLYHGVKYKSFNDFFIRKRNEVIVNMDSSIFVSPCDARVMCYKIDDETKFKIKNSYYSVSDLIKDEVIARKYKDGYAFVFRLCARDYHRYIYVDNGYKSGNVFIPGVLNTVRPISSEHFNVYKENSREYTILYTENFKEVIEVEVGAMLVGKIKNLHGRDYKFTRGEEKGYFMFGGSTIVMFVKKGVLEVDSDILKNSKDGVETLVSIGSRIGKKL